MDLVLTKTSSKKSGAPFNLSCDSLWSIFNQQASKTLVLES